MKESVLLDILSKIENLIQEGKQEDAILQTNLEISLLHLFSDLFKSSN